MTLLTNINFYIGTTFPNLMFMKENYNNYSLFYIDVSMCIVYGKYTRSMGSIIYILFNFCHCHQETQLNNLIDVQIREKMSS